MPRKQFKKMKTVFLTALALAVLAGCKTEKDKSIESYLVPQSGFTSQTLSLIEGSAGTIYIKMPVTLPAGYENSLKAESTSTDVEFTLAMTVSTSNLSTATDGEDFSIGDIFFSGDFDDPYFLVPLTIIDDDVFEETETLILQFTSTDVSRSTSLFNQMTVTIADDDISRKVSFNSSSQVGKEGDVVTLNVNLSTESLTSQTFPITISGTTTLGSDYSLGKPVYTSSGQSLDAIYSLDDDELKLVLEFPAGITSISVPVNLFNDGLGEKSEYILFQLDGDTGNSYSVGEQNSTKVFIMSAYGVNDSGITKFSDGSVIQALNTSPADYPNQDAKTGSSTSGAADNGFDLARLSYDGNVSSSTTSESADETRCVADNTTGLIWSNLAAMPDLNNNGISDTLEQSVNVLDINENPVVVNISGHFNQYADATNITKKNLLYANMKYFYQDADETRNGGVQGVTSPELLYSLTILKGLESETTASSLNTSTLCAPLHPNSEDDTSVSCTTSSVIKYLNTNAYCGQTDWRLPSVQELYSIVNLQEKGGVKSAFSPVIGGVLPSYKFMTRTTAPNARGANLCVTGYGQVTQCNKLEANNVLMVSGEE